MDIKCSYCKRTLQVYQICLHCENAFYCNNSHKTLHEPQHKLCCFPAVVNSEENAGRFWVASRNIFKGELIFSENALVIGPNMESFLSPLYPTCLGCCRGTNTAYSCSKCHWPVCSKKCEKVAQHANYECKVFKKNKVHPSARPQYYLFIQFLRALILKKTNPEAFRNMMELEPHLEARRTNKEEAQVLKSFYKFLTEDCKLQYAFELVDKVVGINRINSYSADVLNSGARKRSCTALFYHASLFNHDCVPNTRSVINEHPDLTLGMKVFAAVDIYKGQQITAQYVPVVKGTIQRRTTLKEWFFDCTCKRCSDPSELGTSFSSVRCSICSDGYMSPENALDYSSRWKCNDSAKCKYTKPFEEIGLLTSRIEKEIEKHEENTQRLEEILHEVIVKPLHPFHYLAITLQYDISQRVVKKLDYVKDYDLIQRSVGYCRNILKVVDVLSPGYSYYRGVIFYYLANLLFALLFPENDEKCKGAGGAAPEDINDNYKVDVGELKQIVDEGITILEVEPKGSVYVEMCYQLGVIQRSLQKYK